MAFFGSGKQEKKQEVFSAPSVSSTPKSGMAAVTGCMEILGNVKGCGSIRIDGKVHGDVKVEEDVVIGNEGIVTGDVSAKKVVVSGKINGTVHCDSLEVTQTGYVADTIHAKKIVSDGKLEAVMSDCDTIHITKNGRVETKKMMAKHIVVNGEIEGTVVATELLEINQDGRVKGEMTVRKIKVSEGGLMLGTMLTYEPTNSVRTIKKESPATDAKEEKNAPVKNEQATSLEKIVKTKEKK